MSGGVRRVTSDTPTPPVHTTGGTAVHVRPAEVDADPSISARSWVERGEGAGPVPDAGGAGAARGPIGRMGVGGPRAPDPSDSAVPLDSGTPRGRAVGLKEGSSRKDPVAERTLPDIRYNSTDAGDFYCEHVYYVAQQQALMSSASVLSNSRGERLVGFIHLPEDSQTTRPPVASPTDAAVAARHRDTRAVVGAGIAGYFNDAASQTDGPVRIMLSGFGPFMSVTDNPSGDFVAHRANIDAAMEAAFGSRLIGRPPAGADMNQPLSYRVRMDDGSEREVQIRALRLPVSDAALDPAAAGSIPSEMARFRPHAVISMGVHPGSSHYDIEPRADDGGLRRDASSGAYRDDTGRARTSEGTTNRSLERGVEWARRHPPAI